jgi:glycine/D-amino acid oxidase-like deaminating enzyme
MTLPHVAIVGTGIIGASIAYHLLKEGARVTLVEAGEPGGIATRASWAWINASWGNSKSYFSFRRRSMAEWRRLAQEVPAIGLRWPGGLIWDLPLSDLEAYAVEHGSWGYGIRRVTRGDALAIEPGLLDPPQFALHVAEEGVVEPLATTLALLDAAKAHGARLQKGRAESLVTADGRVNGIATDDGAIAADHVVIAAGADTPRLAATVGLVVPLETPPGLLVHSKRAPPCLNGLVMASELHMRQTADGNLVAGSDFGGADPGDNPEATARDLFRQMTSMLKIGDRIEYDFHTVGYRPTPADGLPIIDSAPGVSGLTLAVMHSGITNAPAVGLFTAQEILKGETVVDLAPYRLARFAREHPLPVSGSTSTAPCP